QVVLFAARPYSAALIGSQHQAAANLTVVARTCATTLIAYRLLLAGWGVLATPIAEIATQLAALIAVRALCLRLCGWLARRPAAADARMLRGLVRYGVMTTVGGLAWTIESTSDVFILGAAF